MGNVTDAGGTTTSFTKTPQAGDDCFTGFNEDLAGVVFLNVMQNDLGGKAKILFSLDDGDNDSGLMSGYVAADLLAQDLARMESTSTDTSANGARIWITADGQVGYDADTLTAAFRDSLDALGAGEVAYDSFIYSIRLGNGTLSWARAYVEFTGVNDALTVIAHEDGAVTEDDDDPTLSDTGTITFDDVDLTDTHEVASVTPDAGNTLGGTLTASVTDAATGAGDGTVTWTYQVANSATQYLADGETVIESFTVAIEDNNGITVNQVIEVTVTGTNDEPTISAAVDSGAVAEDGTTTDSGTIDFADVDLADVHTVAVDPADTGYLGTFTAGVTDPSTGDGTGQVTWDFSVDNADLQHLAQDEVLTQTYTVTIDDGEGGTVSQTVTITIDGINDAPVAAAVADDANEDGPAVTVAADYSDVDASDTHTFTVDTTGTLGSVTDHGDGTFTYDPNGAFESLAAGESATDTFSYTVDDGNGGSDTETVTITVHGQNDAPDAEDDEAEGDEDTIISGSVATNDDDVDDGASLTYTVNGTAPAGFSMASNGGWTLNAAVAAYQLLGAGESTEVEVEYTVDDGLGGTDTATLTITVNGVNDAAVVGGTDDGEVTEDGTLTASGTLTVDDADGVDEETFVAQSVTNAYGTFTLEADGDWDFVLDNDAAALDDLDAIESEVLSFEVETDDGTNHSVEVTVNGADELVPYTPPPVFNGTGDPNDFDTLTGGTLNSGSNINLGSGNDVVTGDGSDQTINGMNGNDTIYAGGGADDVNGGNQNDTLYGQAGIDLVSGNNGLDTLYGGSGDDTLSGGNDADTIYGGSGSDSITGIGGDDIIIGGYGADTLTGGGDNDRFLYLSELDTGDTITDLAAGDIIDLSIFSTNSFAGLLTSPNDLGANEVGYMTDGTTTTLFVDTDGDATVDMEIYLSNAYVPVLANFDFV